MKKIATPSGRAIPGVGSPPSMWIRGMSAEAIDKNEIVYVDSSPVTGTAIESTALGAGILLKYGVATNATKKKAHGSLYLCLTAASAAGEIIHVCPIGVLNTLDTSGATKGDPVYLSTGGGVTLTAPTGGAYQRIVGEVIGVGVAGTGLWTFSPAQVSSGLGASYGNIITGTATITNGTATVTVSAPLGVGGGGAPAWAVFIADDGVLVVNSVVWSTDDLVINASGNTTADRLVRYFILA